MSERTYRWTLAGIVFFLAVWIAFPFMRFASYPAYQGLVPLRSGDEGAYYDRIQTALLGRWDEVSNGITGPGIYGVGSAGVELVTGFLLQKTGLHGPEAGVLLMVTIAPLFFLFFALFLRTLGVSRWMSLGVTAVYTLMMLGSLQRPVALSFVLPYTALVLLLFSNAYTKGGWLRIALSAVTIGLLPAVYFWSWTFLWASLAIAFLLHEFFMSQAVQKMHQRWRMVGIGGAGFLLSLPILIRTWLMQVQSPAYSDVASYRSGLYPSYGIESWPRSALLLVLTISAIVLFIRRKNLRTSLLIPVALVIGIFIASHQNLIHGKDLMFASHYYPFLCLAAVSLAAVVLAHESLRLRSLRHQWPSYAILGITSIFLVAGFSDYRITWALPLASEKHLDTQHLAPILQTLSDGKRQMILTDAHAALMIKAWTDDDVVFTPYVQSLLVTDEDYIRRSCLSELSAPAGPDISRIAWELTQYRGIHLLPQREAQVRSICTPFLANPRKALSDYAVELLLWDEEHRPDWKINTALFQKTEQGKGWSLWALKAR